ncbi:MFS transporter [Microcella daejeonensis]|uniref:MFS transporter n=1 Tax=Microcella daejeonensis TaxID=2994971 RepID=UPI00226F73AF|nr:MFS transporter [Microcella daejeonensis]WAB82996.1 MFS transporter [Microcella daejeonensis]
MTHRPAETDAAPDSEAPDSAAIGEDGYTDRTRWQAFAVAVAVASLTILDLSKVNVGIPAIELAFGAGPTEIQLIVAGYVLAFGIVLVPAGRLGDLSSRRRLFLVGLVVFLLASLFCAIAPTVELLAASRILQGVSAGLLMPQVLGLIQQLFTGAARGRAFGVFGAVIGLATAFGPTLGGLLIGIGGPEDGWRLIFWMNVPLVLLLFPFAYKLLPRTQPTTGAAKDLDLIGTALLGGTVLSLMLPFVLTTGAPSDDPARWWWLAVFAGLATVFVLWERRYTAGGRTAIVDFALFRIGGYRNGILISTFYFAAMPATFLTLSLFLQFGLGLEPVYAGMVTIPFALASAVTSWYSGKVVTTYGRSIVVLGLFGVVIGFGGVLASAFLLPAAISPWVIAAFMTIAGAGGGAVIAPNQTLTLADVPVTSGGVAGSIGQVGQRVGTAVGIAAATAAFYVTIYAEEGSVGELMLYQDAFRNAALVILTFVGLALLLALVDLRGRKAGTLENTPSATEGLPQD